MTQVLFAGLLLAALVAAGCTTDYNENCFAKASAGSGQDAKGTGGEGAGDGTGSGKSDSAAESGCSRTPTS